MGLFSKKKKNVVKIKRKGAKSTPFRSNAHDPGDESYIDEFREGIEEISDMFRTDGSVSDKFAQLVFGLANFNQYRNSVYDEMIDNGASPSEADRRLRSIILDAGLCDMMITIINFREKSPRRRKR